MSTDYDDCEPGDYREPDPEDHPEFERYERERYLRSLSPLARLWEPARALIWRHTWRWRIKPNADEPPF